MSIVTKIKVIHERRVVGWFLGRIGVLGRLAFARHVGACSYIGWQGGARVNGFSLRIGVLSTSSNLLNASWILLVYK